MADANAKKSDFAVLVETALPEAEEQAKVCSFCSATCITRALFESSALYSLPPSQRGDLNGALEKLLALEKRTRSVGCGCSRP